MQLPSNMLLPRVRPSVYLGVAATAWGAVSTCTPAVQNFPSLIAVRLILGFVECPFFPGAIFLMSSWYTRAELTRRISRFYSGNALANIFLVLVSSESWMVRKVLLAGGGSSVRDMRACHLGRLPNLLYNYRRRDHHLRCHLQWLHPARLSL